ncbi:ABC transporter ATP-binding protein [Paenibacillus koleovorans]|uniref:ABC transporter ATP-binding protein n=1 Tax=Paenibacillus koleovorans TaxID=121608 RepID=UPI000FD869DA|nr:ABC transporter ATP-binding protein [Paenibacillus koleovorans]
MKIMLRILKYTIPYKGWTAVALLMLALGVAFDLLAPWFLKQTIDVGIAESRMSAVILFALLLFFGQILKSIGMYYQGVAQERVGQNVVFDIRQQVYAHLQRLSFGYYDKAQTGQIMSRMTGDIEAIKNFVGFGAMLLVTGLLTFVGTFIVMLMLHWQVTVISMVTIPFLLIVLRQFNRKVGPAWSDIREQMGRLTTTLQENISGIRVVKAFAREKTEKEKFSWRNDTNFQSNVKRAKIEAGAFPLMGFYGGVVFLLMIWAGGTYVIKDEMSIGTLMAFQWYAWGLLWPLQMLGWLINIMQQALKAAPRVFEIVDTPAAIHTPEDGGRTAESIRGHVVFDQVDFRFPTIQPFAKTGGDSESKAEQPIEPQVSPVVLDALSLDIRPGEVIAILGATGSGKTSLINLLPRFYDVTGGRLLIDGVDVKEYTLEGLRRKIGIVPQETFLFSATIRENIAYGVPDATQERIEWAAAKAQIHEFIQTLQDGYDTIIGERGVGLSGGQRQRVALARAILMDPPILVLDEATASVDTATESAIHEALHDIMQGRTTFIVAQRLSSIQRADRIIVLQDGRILQMGTHAELASQDGFFRNLYAMQQTPADEPASSPAPSQPAIPILQAESR